MKCYHVDAFADNLFEGNPAAVCVMQSWLPDELMQSIAAENNLSETAFTVKEDGLYHLRWFTPGGEIDLCGHATLATAFVIANYIEKGETKFTFTTLSGLLNVVLNDGLYEMDFPGYDLLSIPVTDAMQAAIGYRPTEAFMGRDLVCVLDDEQKIIDAQPNQSKILELDGLLLQITAKSDKYDCVTRTFAPKLNVAEDPVCGSGHCHVAPLWAKKLSKNSLVARQASKRGGTVYCRINDDRVVLSGKACLYSISDIFI